jgi:hypothetical protein
MLSSGPSRLATRLSALAPLLILQALTCTTCLGLPGALGSKFFSTCAFSSCWGAKTHGDLADLQAVEAQEVTGEELGAEPVVEEKNQGEALSVACELALAEAEEQGPPCAAEPVGDEEERETAVAVRVPECTKHTYPLLASSILPLLLPASSGCSRGR